MKGVRHFSSKVGYKKWLAAGHIHKYFAKTPGHQKIFIRGKPHKVCHKKSQAFVGLIVGIIMAFMVITMLVTLLPGFTEMIDTAQGSNYLNCAGYVDTRDDGGNFSYNGTIGSKSTIACLGMKLFLPYIVLGVLIALVIKILYDKGTQPQQGYY